MQLLQWGRGFDLCWDVRGYSQACAEATMDRSPLRRRSNAREEQVATDLKSWVEISSGRLTGNLRAVQAVASAGAGMDVEVLAVVKADAYGHDAAVVAPVLAVAAGGTHPDPAARWLGVSDWEEGARVRQALGAGSDTRTRNTRILVMCAMDPGLNLDVDAHLDSPDAAELVAHGLTPVVWTPGHVAAMNRAGQAAGRPAEVHLEIDTGMARQGVAPGEDLAATLKELKASPWVSCEGLMSHLAAAEVQGPLDGSAPGRPEPAKGLTNVSGLTERQRARFSTALEQVTAAGVRPRLLHLGNSSAVDEGSTLGWIGEAARRIGARPMVRTGFALYGHCLPLESSGVANGVRVGGGLLAPHLLPALTWKTRIVGLRDIATGDTVGYGATFTAAAPMRLALLPVGYADGFRRAASSGGGPGVGPGSAQASPGESMRDWVRGWVCIQGQRAPVVGRVSMNLTTVDVTAIPEAVLGGEVVLLGEGVTAEDHAAWSSTIGYDILCGIRARVELVS